VQPVPGVRPASPAPAGARTERTRRSAARSWPARQTVGTGTATVVPGSLIDVLAAPAGSPGAAGSLSFS